MIDPSENPELWDFLSSLHSGELLTGTIAAIEPFGVFVALDDGPDHPLFPGVGFITYPELSWTPFNEASEVLHVGQRVSCEFLQFDTWNGEARLSLRATRPDPFQLFADGIEVGQELQGRVTEILTFGVIVEVADGIEGLIHVSELAGTPCQGTQGVVRPGAYITVVVTGLDRQRRTVSLSQKRTSKGSP
ncbi:S1 RNA-binding domain-containing protein [Streptomyces sp. NPDC058734]|uniref:S1 RNA-binding domain-containing protein n=1 Tax=Streptomyces sp. NPDC058734 TaxID=3346615 RepID=UPI003688D684